MIDDTKVEILDGDIEGFAETISAAWHRAAASVIEAATTLKKAQEQLGKKRFGVLRGLLETNGLMSTSTVSKLLTIADNPMLTAPENIPRLPASYATLYDIAREDTAAVQSALEKGLLTAATTHKDARKLFSEDAMKVVRQPTSSIQSVSIRFKGDVGSIPDDLWAKLNSVLEQLEEYVDVSSKGKDL